MPPVPVSVIEQAVAAVNAVIAAAGTDAEANVVRGRLDPVTIEEKYTASTYQGAAQPYGPSAGRETNGLTNEMVTVRVDVGVKDPEVDDLAIETVLNEFAAQVHEAVMADHTLGGIAIDVIWAGLDEPQIEGKGQIPSGVLTMNFGVHVRHATMNLRTAVP